MIHSMARTLAALLLCGVATAQVLDEHTHMGVASCSGSVCHGKIAPAADSPVWLNEYRVWSAEDRHARAYQTLLSDASERMAKRLGLTSARTADLCLDCHADNVPTARRGPKFRLDDGVGCEACHGGSELWLDSHTEPGVTHADNLSRGLLATESIDVRANVCLGCHLGTGDQFATHRIMAAGHPRLAFELEAYSVNQPAHFTVDADYRERKGAVPGFDMWRSGQVQSLRRLLALIASPRFDAHGFMPDFAFYDCHSCHHPMSADQLPQVRLDQGLAPGALRLQDANLFMLRALASVVAPAAEARLHKLHLKLLRSGWRSVDAARAAAAELDAWLAGQSWTRPSGTTDPEVVAAVRLAIAALAARGELADYAVAEQAFLAIETLSLQLGDAETLQQHLDRLYAVVADEDGFRASRFRSAAAALLTAL